MSSKSSITLYHYLHCPFCIRVRLVCGLLGIEYNSEVLPYSDEESPIKLTGKKMAPILQKYDGTFMNESLDIISYLDTAGTLKVHGTNAESTLQEINEWIGKISKPLFNLLMPYYLNNIEFSDQDRLYFQRKKEIKRGPFRELAKNRNQFIQEVNEYLMGIKNHFQPYYKSSDIQLHDILLTSHLWGLYLAYDYRVPEWLHQYLQLVSHTCHFSYDWDWWKNH
jgi:glutaredoxin 2